MGHFKGRNNRLRGNHGIEGYEPLLCKRRQNFFTEGGGINGNCNVYKHIRSAFVLDFGILIKVRMYYEGVRLPGTTVTDT